ncbi:hypothetical protein [Thermopolyspora flexuosa]|uniref:hypothetical protein n=1 Tax=Thermopolyspora flexuosa TaxID=103836 RepID=UPI00114EA8FA|nr:hypothetical protein [Thermopolyspora flexuosa]
MPWSIGPLTAAGLAVAVLLARVAPTVGAVVQLFSAVVPVVLLLGAVAACSHRSDPRLEPLSAMPVSPAMAFATGLARVLGIDLVLALVASGVLVAVGAATGLAAVVAGRLGRALPATSAGVVVAIWRSPAFSTTAGAAGLAVRPAARPAVPYRPVPACGCPGARVAARPGGLAGPPAAAVRRGRLTRASGLRGEATGGGGPESVSPSAVRPGPTRVPPRRPRHHRWRSPVPQARATAPPAA